MSLLLSVVLMLAAVGPNPQIVGTVVDTGGKPASGVPISILALPSEQMMKTTVSGSDGSFSFSDLAPGLYGVSAKTASACAFSDAIRVNRGFTRMVRLHFVKGLCQNGIANMRSAMRYTTLGAMSNAASVNALKSACEIMDANALRDE